MLHIALYQPAIPQNTGNIGRLCVGMGAALHLIGPIGFDLSDKAVRRAGLDYWPHLVLTVHESPDAFLRWLGSSDPAPPGSVMATALPGGAETQARESDHITPHNLTPWLVTKFGSTRFDRAPYADGDVLILGNENTGLPEAWHERWPDRRITVPMPGNMGVEGTPGFRGVRSYNLANTAAIVLATATARLDG